MRIKYFYKAFQTLVLERTASVLLPDALYLKFIFRLRMGYRLELKCSKTFSEKLQWLKLYYRDPSYPKLVDKYDVKYYISTKLGPEFVIPTIGIWDNPECIDWEKLPSKFVLKTTHGGGSRGVVVCKDKVSLDKTKVIENLRNSMNQNIYNTFREWPYAHLKPRVLAETMMEQEDGSDLMEYKFFCFNGVPQFLYLRDHSGKETTITYLTMDWNFAPIKRLDYKRADELPARPIVFETMRDVAAKLSADFPFVRVDLYVINNQVYFSELTFFPSSGLLPFDSYETDKWIGDLLILPEKNN